MDEFLDKYQKSNNTKSKRTIMTMKQNIQRIEKLIGKDVKDFKISDFKDVNGIVDKITEKYNLNSAIQTILGIIKYFDLNNYSNKIIEEYRELLNELVVERNEQQNNQDFKNNEGENWIDYEELKEKIEDLVPSYLDKKMAFSKFRNFLIIALFSLIPPARISHYVNMVKKYKKDLKVKPQSLASRKNYIIIDDEKTPNEFTFVFNTYKTSKTSGKVINKITNKDLIKLLEMYFNEYNNDKKNPNFLINVNGKEMSQENITNSQRSTTKKLLGKSISNNLFRHIFLTYFTELNPSINEKIRIGELIGQKYKPTQMEKYRRIKPTPENVILEM